MMQKKEQKGAQGQHQLHPPHREQETELETQLAQQHEPEIGKRYRFPRNPPLPTLYMFEVNETCC